MKFPEGLLYTKDHEWASTAGDVVTVGLTDHAQEALGEIVYVELPKVGRQLKAHDTFGVVESIKAVSDCYSPVAGEIVEVNDSLTDSPGSINQSPYEGGWLIKIRLSDKNSLQGLMNASQYTSYVDTLK